MREALQRLLKAAKRANTTSRRIAAIDVVDRGAIEAAKAALAVTGTPWSATCNEPPLPAPTPEDIARHYLLTRVGEGTFTVTVRLGAPLEIKACDECNYARTLSSYAPEHLVATAVQLRETLA